MQAEDEQLVIREQVGFLWTWWKGDELPMLSQLADFSVEETRDVRLITKLMLLNAEETMTRFQEGHRTYVARLGKMPVAYGWSASNHTSFGSPVVHFVVPARNRYLYHFATFPSWRGRGIYPRLLQAMLMSEGMDHERFWIIHQLSNVASQRGIAKAGFQVADNVHLLSTGGLGLVSDGESEKAQAGARMLGLPLLAEA